MSLFTAALALCGALSSVGCTGPRYVTLDADVDDAAQAPDGTLVLLSAPSLAIRPGEIAAIEVRCVGPGGVPRIGADVTFAIEGAALDSTLSTIGASTDGDGRASGGIVAGTQATSFRVRIVSAAAALPIYVDVGVGTSFGTLVVHAPYDGSRIVTRRVIDVVPRARCADLVGAPPEVGARALPTGSDDLSIAGLPTTVPYAVLARAESDVALTATGCVDDVVLEADRTTEIEVPYADAPLAIDGSYAAAIELHGSAATDAAFVLLASTVEAASDSRGGDAHALLDALRYELAARVSPDAAIVFDEARASDSLDLALLDRMLADGSAPTAVTLRWAAAAQTAMSHLQIDATLVVATPGASIVTTVLVTSSDAADGRVSLAPTSFDPPMGEPRSVVVSADGTRDVVMLESLTLDAPLGALLMAWLDAVANSDGLAGAAGLLAPACGTLRAFVSEVPAAAACDDACVEAACAVVIAAQVADLQTASSLLDLTVGLPSTSGSLAATDADGDVRVDSLAGGLTGSYVDGTAITLGPISGSITLTRAPAAP